MGKRRKDSDRFKLERLSKPEEQRDTLNPCEACGGRGTRKVKRVVEVDSVYRTVDVELACNWCKGSGSVTKELAKAFYRWTKILRHNRAAGRCPKADSS